MSSLSLVAHKRDPKAKLSELRENASSVGSVPWVIYGKKVESTPLIVNTSDLLKTFRESGFSHIISLDLDGKKHQVLIQDVQVHPVKGTFLHVDFYAIVATEKLTVTVPVKIVGSSQAVRDGAVLEQILHDIDVRCMPTDIPECIEVDISPIDHPGVVIHISDLVIDNKKIEILHHEPHDAVVTAAAVKEYVEETPAEVEVINESDTEESDEGESSKES